MVGLRSCGAEEVFREFSLVGSPSADSSSAHSSSMTTTPRRERERAIIGRQGENWEKGKMENGKPVQYTSKCTSANPLGTVLFCSKDLQEKSGMARIDRLLRWIILIFDWSHDL